MIHYVKEAAEKAFKTVERFTKKKIHCLNSFEPFKDAKGSFIIANCSNGSDYILFIRNPVVSKENNEKDENVLYNRKSYDHIRGENVMIFKVYFQDRVNEVPVREKTKTFYVKAESVRDVLTKIADRGLNVEYIQEVKGAYLEYEQQNENFKVLEI